MNILFLTLLDFSDISEKGIYTDLLREFIKNGHAVWVISPTEKRRNIATHLIQNDSCTILKLRIGNIQKTNFVEKGISTLAVESQLISGIKKYFGQVRFDLILYSTPPITFCRAVEYVKERDHAKTYLLLKDIFPQNAVDLGMLSKRGYKAALYKYFRWKEKKLYAVSDMIGCMSPANVEYLLRHNPEISRAKVEVCPNSIEIQDYLLKEKEKQAIRIKHDIPTDKIVFVYGGNLGKPQGIPFVIDCLKTQEQNPDVFFLIVGDGTEFGKLEAYFKERQPLNMKLLRSIPKDDYDRLVAACDVGLIFLDHRFTIPNFPSRLLSYMHASLPILACTDVSSDIGVIIEEGGFGYWCACKDVDGFNKKVQFLSDSELRNKMGINARTHLENNYTTKHSYAAIMVILTHNNTLSTI